MSDKTILQSEVSGHEGPCRQIDYRWVPSQMAHVGIFRSVHRILFWWRFYGDEFEGYRRPFDGKKVVSLPPTIVRRSPVGLMDKYGRVTSGTRARHAGLSRSYEPEPTPAPSSSITQESDPYPYRSYGTTTGRTPSEYVPPFHSGRSGDYAGAGATGSWDTAESVGPQTSQAMYAAQSDSPSAAPAPDESCRASDYASEPASSPPPSDPPASDSSSSSDSGSSSGDSSVSGN